MLPEPEEFIRALKDILKTCEDADDLGSIHFAMAELQEWVKTWPQILNEQGGI